MKITSLSTDRIDFDNGAKLHFYHETDCCEAVYADCENIQSLSPSNFHYDEVEFNQPPNFFMEKGVGVVLVARTGMKYLISCYNQQNGYYSSDLSMSFIDARGRDILLVSDVEKIDEIDD